MIDRDRLVSTFLDLVRIDSPPGKEQEVAAYCARRLSALGFTVESDAAGNLFCKLPGQGEPVMVNAHMDSVQPCIGIKPIVEGDVIRSDGATVLGTDDRASVAAILEVMRLLVEGNLPHPPIEAVFTVREELGLEGSREMDYSHISATVGFVLDHHGPAGAIVVAAPYQNELRVVVHGRAAHAGSEPEKGISAIRVAAEAIAAMPLGRIDPETTSNIGTIHGGLARNAVPDRVEIVGEARSRNEEKLEKQTATMAQALHDAAARHGATVDIAVNRNYHGFRVTPDNPVLQRLQAAIRACGIEPRSEESGGGSDVNVFRRHGIDALAMSAGYNQVHTKSEYLNISDMVNVARVLLAALTL
jgi:tripeptide aminopeptidase